VPLYAAREGLVCGNCHFDHNGGGPRNDFGFAFARNRHGLTPDTTGAWAELDLTNRIGETMPVYLGINHRFMALGNDTESADGIDRAGFFNMENAIHVAFQPHHQLTLAYTTDAFASGANSPAQTREAWGRIGGLPLNGFVRAGRFRVPFGLRWDDHTVATRNGFLDFADASSFLPYDPRDPDMGLEVGGEYGPMTGRVSFTNGPVNVFAGGRAQTAAAKLVYNAPWYQGSVSFYDAYNGRPSGALKRATRWGYYGMTHYGPLAGIWEVAAGTDEDQPVVPGTVSGPKTNLLAYNVELNYTPFRWLHARVRYDHLETDRASDDALRDARTHDRYAVEAEYVPVPFAELRATLRRIDHKDETAYGYDDETQAYLQFHFSY